MKYIKLFENHSDYAAYVESQDYLTPNVSYCVDLNEVHFNKYVRDYSKEYFTIEALEDGNVYFRYLSFATTTDQRYMEYSKDNGQTWTRTTNVDNEEVVMTISMTIGEKALVRGSNDTLKAYNELEERYFNSYFYSDIEFNVYGNIMSLTHGDTFIGETTITEYMFNGLFFDTWGNYDSGVLSSCYVVDASNLILPSTTLATRCYALMFEGCTSLTSAPELPALTAATECYFEMFYGCTSLTTAPELPATTLANSCYSHMFDGCTSLTSAPELPATTLAEMCYQFMFRGCTSLTTAPELPVTTLVSNCYYGMFDGCTSLTSAPELPATTLAEMCYQSMFYGCTNLTTAPELPATTLVSRCYQTMFRGCTSLTTAPELPATTLVSNCYNYMFYGCTNLNYIKAMFTTTPSTTYTYNWVNGVSSTGTFVKNSAASWNVTGSNGIPSGWTVQTASA